MNYLHTAQHWFAGQDLKRKLSLLISLAFILILTLLLSWWALSPSYATLFNHLDEADANKVLSQLDQENIPYQLRHGGQDILIDKDLVAKTRLKIMGAGLQLSGNVGFELFDKNDFGMTDFSQKINYQRALQGELERTISGFDEIGQVRVHLVIPESHLFTQEENQPKAAITLHLKHPLTNKQIVSIQQLVAASVANLRLNNVVVVDQNGNALSQEEEDNTNTHFAAKQNIEHYLNDKVRQILHPIFSKNQVLVNVNVELNYDELQRELIKPQNKGQISHEKEIKHSSLDPKSKHQGKQDITLEKTYELGSEKELFKRASGTIERLSVSVVLPQDTSLKTIAQIQRLIKSSIGFNEKRGDLISVEALINKPTLTPKKAPAHFSEPEPRASNLLIYSWYESQKTLLLCLVLLLIGLGSTGAFLLQRIRHKKRQQLLLELTHWLNHHES